VTVPVASEVSSGDAIRRAIRARVLGAIAANRAPGFHFPGHLLDLQWPAVDRDQARVLLPASPHVAGGDGIVDIAAVAILIDVALGTAARLHDAHEGRQATVELHVQFGGVLPRGDIGAVARARGPGAGPPGRQSLTEATLEADGRVVARALGTFTRLGAPDGVVLGPLPWQRDAASRVGAADEQGLEAHERDIVARCDAALARTTPSTSFIRALLCGERSALGRTLEVGTHVGNRVGHVHGGVLLAFALATVEDIIPARMQLSSASAWFVRPGSTPQLVATPTVLHAGRTSTLVRVDAAASDGSAVAHTMIRYVANDV
jgi:acyl-coenzyme A thioesterase PaaI-like protein